MLELKERLGKGRIWADVESMLGISETRRKQFVALLNLPEDIQREIVALGRRPAKSSVTEKHARALLMLNRFPEKQLELFDSIKNSRDPIAGDAAIEKAKEIKGQVPLHVFRIVYRTEEELIEKLETELRMRKGRTEKQGDT